MKTNHIPRVQELADEKGLDGRMLPDGWKGVWIELRIKFMIQNQESTA